MKQSNNGGLIAFLLVCIAIPVVLAISMGFTSKGSGHIALFPRDVRFRVHVVGSYEHRIVEADSAFVHGDTIMLDEGVLVRVLNRVK